MVKLNPWLYNIKPNEIGSIRIKTTDKKKVLETHIYVSFQ